MGDQHLDIIVSKLKERYKVDIELSKPKVAFRETIRKSSDVEGKIQKQSGGHGQYGHVKMKFEPSGDLETPCVFEQIVEVGGAVPKNYFPGSRKGTAGIRIERTSCSISCSRREGQYCMTDHTIRLTRRSRHLRWRRSWPSRKVSWMHHRCFWNRS